MDIEILIAKDSIADVDFNLFKDKIEELAYNRLDIEVTVKLESLFSTKIIGAPDEKTKEELFRITEESFNLCLD